MMTLFAAPEQLRPPAGLCRPGARVTSALLLAVLALSALALAGPAAAARSCSTRGLTVGAGKGAPDMKVVSLSVQGIGCSKAAGVARQVAGDLASGRTISLDGVADMSISTVIPCGGCSGETQVSLGYPSASISLSLGGRRSSRRASAAAASLRLRRIPQFPTPAGPGGGSVTF